MSICVSFRCVNAAGFIFGLDNIARDRGVLQALATKFGLVPCDGVPTNLNSHGSAELALTSGMASVIVDRASMLETASLLLVSGMKIAGLLLVVVVTGFDIDI